MLETGYKSKGRKPTKISNDEKTMDSVRDITHTHFEG